ncbi:MAG TPA: prenyltransferase/squalene oxidase repeat-containing protein [Micromonosporaceae bacterium]|nr:prenyltransferase/squalene oxidase repeat-containing protein [Micromonosporaceae bacterium]
MRTRAEPELVEWLLEGDPAIRWRVLQYLTDASDDEVAEERSRVATEGWGARVLAAQNPDGGWGDGVYSPKWTSTTYTLLRLLWLGLPSGHPAALRGCEQLWAWQSRWRVPETCIVGILVRLTSYHGYAAPRLDGLVEYLLDQQLADGGWNCATRTDKSKHSSFHTSIQALEALDAYQSTGGRIDVREPVRDGREFFLDHKLYQSHRTGAVAIRGSTRFPAFPEWHFDVLRGLEHFAQGDAPRDERLAEAADVVRRARRRDGRWSTYSPYPGRQWFQLEPPGASRWNTGRVLRVLRWWGDEFGAG